MLNKRFIIAFSFILAASGFLLPFWPLEILGVLLAALTWHPIIAVTISLLMDLGSGTPTGIFHYLLFPFTLLSLLLILMRSLGGRYFIKKSQPPTL